MASQYEVALQILDQSGQNVAYTGTAGSLAIPTGVFDVWAWSTTDCFVRIGDARVATAASFPMPAYTPVRLRVPNPGLQTNQVSAIQISSAGTLYIGSFAV